MNSSLLNLVLRPGVFPCVLCRCCLRLPTNCPSTSCPTRRRSVRCWILAELTGLSTAPRRSTLLQTVSGVCLLVVRVCRTVDRVVGPPRAFPLKHRCTVGVLAGTHWCALMPSVASKQSAHPFCGCLSVVLSVSCGRPNTVNVISLHCSCTSCLTATVASQSLDNDQKKQTKKQEAKTKQEANKQKVKKKRKKEANKKHNQKKKAKNTAKKKHSNKHHKNNNSNKNNTSNRHRKNQQLHQAPQKTTTPITTKKKLEKKTHTALSDRGDIVKQKNHPEKQEFYPIISETSVRCD